jgi:hypothetical protein
MGLPVAGYQAYASGALPPGPEKTSAQAPRRAYRPDGRNHLDPA